MAIYHPIKPIKVLLFSVIFLVLLYNFVSFVRQNALDMPFWDGWDVADLVMQKGNWLEAITLQHNEHRIGTGLVLMKMLAPLTGWSQLVETAVVSIEIILSCLLVLYVKKKITEEITFFDFAIPLIFLNILQWGNILFAFQITFVFPLLFLCLGIWALTIKDIVKRNILLVTFSLLGTFSSLHGLFIPIVFIVFLLTELLVERFKDWRIRLLAITAEIFVVVLYFWGYEKKLQTAVSLKPDFSKLDFFTTMLANGFFYHGDISRTFGLGYFLAAVTLYFFLFGIYKIIFGKEKKIASWAGVIMIAFALLFIFSITLGRSAFGIAQASETRYITFSMLAPLGIYFILESSKRKNIARLLLIVLLLAGLFTYPKYINDSVEKASKARKEAAQCYQIQKPEEFSSCFKIAPLYPDEARLHGLMLGVLEYKSK